MPSKSPTSASILICSPENTYARTKLPPEPPRGSNDRRTSAVSRTEIRRWRGWGLDRSTLEIFAHRMKKLTRRKWTCRPSVSNMRPTRPIESSKRAIRHAARQVRAMSNQRPVRNPQNAVGTVETKDDHAKAWQRILACTVGCERRRTPRGTAPDRAMRRRRRSAAPAIVEPMKPIVLRTRKSTRGIKRFDDRPVEIVQRTPSRAPPLSTMPMMSE